MAGLTRDGFIPLTYDEITTRISTRLNVFSSGIDLTPESPDGQLVSIFSFELSQLWSELALVYDSYNPNNATGAGLRNLGLITGLQFGAATRSQATVQLVGTEGTVIPLGSTVLDSAGNIFRTSFRTTIPASVQVVADLSGPIDVTAGTLVVIGTAISGWDSVTQNATGIVGAPPQTEVQFRNTRNATVLRNFVTVEETIRGRLQEDLGIDQVNIVNNDESIPVGDVPANTIHVTIGEIGEFITDEDIAQVILNAKGLGCPTYGSTEVIINDDQGYPHTIRFSKAVGKSIFIKTNVTFLDDDFAGAAENIQSDLVDHINLLVTGEDVIWSRLFGIITPYSKAQVNSLELSFDGITYVSANLAIAPDEFAFSLLGLVEVTETNT